MLLDHGTHHATRTTKSRFHLSISLSPSPWTLEVWWLGDSSSINGSTGSTCPHHPLVWPQKEDPTGHLLHAPSKAMQLETGYSRELLMAPLSLADNETNLWIKHFLVSTQECSVNLMTDFVNYPPQCQGNIELMRLFVQMGWQQLELNALNHCRMYLRVFLLSDIVIGLGAFISLHFWDQYNTAESPFDWLCTNKLPPNSWIMWCKVLTEAFNLGHNQWLALLLGNDMHRTICKGGTITERLIPYGTSTQTNGSSMEATTNMPTGVS